MIVDHDGLYRLSADVLAANLSLDPGGVVQQIRQGKVRFGAPVIVKSLMSRTQTGAV